MARVITQLFHQKLTFQTRCFKLSGAFYPRRVFWRHHRCADFYKNVRVRNSISSSCVVSQKNAQAIPESNNEQYIIANMQPDAPHLKSRRLSSPLHITCPALANNLAIFMYSSVLISLRCRSPCLCSVEGFFKKEWVVSM